MEKINVIESVILSVEIWGESADRVNENIKRYNSMSAEMAQRVFEKNLDPDRFITVILGQKEKIVPQFEKAGIPVEVIEM